MKAACLFLLFIMSALTAMALSGCNFLFSEDEKTSTSASSGHVWKSNIDFEAARNRNISAGDVFQVNINAKGERGFWINFECFAADAGRRFGSTGSGSNDLTVECQNFSSQNDLPKLFLFLPNSGDPFSNFLLSYLDADIISSDFVISATSSEKSEFLAISSEIGLKFSMAAGPIDSKSPLRPFFQVVNYLPSEIHSIDIEIKRGL